MTPPRNDLLHEIAVYAFSLLALGSAVGLLVWAVVAPSPHQRRHEVVLNEIASLRAVTQQRFDELAQTCGPMIITTYERGDTVITGPDGEEIK